MSRHTERKTCLPLAQLEPLQCKDTADLLLTFSPSLLPGFRAKLANEYYESLERKLSRQWLLRSWNLIEPTQELVVVVVVVVVSIDEASKGLNESPDAGASREHAVAIPWPKPCRARGPGSTLHVLVVVAHKIHQTPQTHSIYMAFSLPLPLFLSCIATCEPRVVGCK